MTDSPQDTIFIVAQNGSLERIPRTDYDSEKLLQGLIQTYPEILSGEQMQPEDPIRWLLVSSEAGIPDGDGNPDRFSVDHLLLDQFGRPTFVEVKRSSDTRIRREVVGQMLDYAANAQNYWPVDRIRALALKNYDGDQNLQVRLEKIVGDGFDGSPEQVENYWAKVQDNLRNGRVRLLFVADEIPKELRRIIEFLNSQMPAVEVLGVEVCQYVGENLKALVPRLVGMTEAVRQTKGIVPSKKTNLETFISRCDDKTADFIREMIQTAEKKGIVVSWGKQGLVLRIRRPNGSVQTLFYGWPPSSDDGYPNLQVYLQYLNNEDERKHVRELFLDAVHLEEKGKWTLLLRLEPQKIPLAEKMMSVFWDVAKELGADSNEVGHPFR